MSAPEISPKRCPSCGWPESSVWIPASFRFTLFAFVMGVFVCWVWSG